MTTALSEKAFFDANSDIETVEAFCVDVNGVLRGKLMPAKGAAKLFDGGLRLPFSAFAVDIWGTDVPAAGLVVETGDRDGLCHPVPGSLQRVPWLPRPTAQVMLSMQGAEGAPFFGDPRHVLSRVLALFKAKGWTPVVAAELEFYLIDGARDAHGFPQPPVSLRTGRRTEGPQNYSLAEISEFAPVLDDVNAFCKQMKVPADATVSEAGPGQFEINLNHVPDALLAADQAVMLKRIVRGAAQKHGLDATFMAKPYGDRAGNGLHVHFSILDDSGRNIFMGKDAKGSDALRHAIGGLLAAMPDSTAVFAPNANSYRRFAKGSHAPTCLAWGYDNRSAAVRVPESVLEATRIEHRVPGADANPYLVLAVMLAAAYDGLVNKADPGAPLSGNIYDSGAKRLPATWEEALTLFENSGFAETYLGAPYRQLYAACKRQEKDKIESRVTSAEYDAYLRDA